MSSAPIQKTRDLASFAQTLHLAPGLYEAQHRGYRGAAHPDSFAVLTAAPGQSGRVGFRTAAGSDCNAVTIAAPGDSAMVEVADPGGDVLLTIFNHAGAERGGLDLGFRPLSGGISASQPAYGGGATGGTGPFLGVIAHIEDTGDIRGETGRWVGTPDSLKRLEGFSLEPPAGVTLQCGSLGPGGYGLRWVAAPQFCGTRQQAAPIRQLAFRLDGTAAQQYSLAYQAAFSDGTRTGLRRDGAVCLAEDGNAFLVAFRLALQPRSAGLTPPAWLG